MSTAGLIVVTVLLGLAVALALTNPTTPEYLDFLNGLVAGAIQRMDPGGSSPERQMLQRIFALRGSMLMESVIAPNTRRRNYGLFSLFETRVLDVHVRTVGIAHRFFPLDPPDEVAVKVGRLIPQLAP